MTYTRKVRIRPLLEETEPEPLAQSPIPELTTARHMRLPNSLWWRVQQQARKECRSMANMVRKLVEEALDRRRP